MKNAPLFFLGLLALALACSDDSGVKPGVDRTAPAQVRDLRAQEVSGRTVLLTWTAPGDDGTEGQAARYDIRYSSGVLSEAVWDSATKVSPPAVPKAAGQVESLSVTGLAPRSWSFALKASDEVPNWSPMSNVSSATLVDTFPPGPVADLAAGFATMVGVDLTWTAPGDDGGEGQASEYDLRYALTPITEENWDEALRVEGVPAPRSAGSPESFTVGDLEPGETYSLALKAIDRAGNGAVLSTVVNRRTAHVVRLTSGHADPPFRSGARWPRWSPDDETIAFQADWAEGGGRIQLYSIPAAGGDPDQLTHDPDIAHQACWSPDGRQIAFISTRTMNAEIYLMDAAPGAAPVKLTDFNGGYYLQTLAWSPDGSRFAGAVDDPFPAITQRLYVFPYDGGTPRLLASGSRFWAGLDWSPDGARIAFVSNRTGDMEIYTVPPDGGQSTRLTRDPAADIDPTWSPDGTQIAFASDRGGDYQIWLMSHAGENPRQVTFGLAGAYDLSWSHDGSRIAFVSYQDDVEDVWILFLE